MKLVWPAFDHLNASDDAVAAIVRRAAAALHWTKVQSDDHQQAMKLFKVAA